MLIEFSVGNYKSFKERITLSMVAANLVAKDKNLDENNVFTVGAKLKLLKTAAIYGANASGKSNLAEALIFIKNFMINSSRESQSTDAIDVEAFRLSTETENQPSFFELVFIMDGIKYRYGFEVTPKRVVSEWLCYVPNTRETMLFERDKDRIKTLKKYDAAAEVIKKRTRDNALFLSVSAQFNVQLAEDILDWVSHKMNIISGLDDGGYITYTVDRLVNNNNKNDIIDLVKRLDLSIDDIDVEQKVFKYEEIPDELKKIIKSSGSSIKGNYVSTRHKKFDQEGNYIAVEEFDLRIHESEGTRKIFALAGPLINTLKTGEILIIDEFDVRLHPLISRAIVELFNSNETNHNKAQLIFMTHDTNLLSNKLFRRDQIWFTEKNSYGATDLYSLAEYKIKGDSSFESDYIKGRYGAIPYLTT